MSAVSYGAGLRKLVLPSVGSTDRKPTCRTTVQWSHSHALTESRGEHKVSPIVNGRSLSSGLLVVIYMIFKVREMRARLLMMRSR
jgi:hypothetical protein